MPTASLDGVDLFYEDQGSGSPVLFVAGGIGAIETWQMQVPEFSKRHRVVTFDRRGTGRSGPGTEPLTVDLLARDARGLLDHLDIPEAAVVANSFGGFVAQVLARLHPERVSDLVLLCSGARFGPVGRLFAELWVALIERGVEARLVAMATMPFAVTPPLMANPEFVVATADRLAGSVTVPDPRTVGSLLADALDFDSRSWLHEIEIPTLVVTGADDVVMPPSAAGDLAKGIAGAEVRILEHGAHAFQTECFSQVNDVVLQFLAR